MMIHEFTELTGFEPSMEEYAEIEQQYYEFDGDKKAFCKHFIENGRIQKVYDKRLATIQQLRSTMIETEKSLMQTIKEKENRIARLEADLEREQEWQPHEYEENVRQAKYEELATCPGTRVLTDEEAVQMIAEEWGFQSGKIRIIHTVSKIEINRHRMCRRVGEYERKPLYNATDWNYIRFDIERSMTYEMFNGELRFFVH